MDSYRQGYIKALIDVKNYVDSHSCVMKQRRDIMTKKRLLSYRQLKAELKLVSTDSDDYRRLKAEIAEIESYVSGIDDAFIRIIFRLRYLVPRNGGAWQPPSWAWIARQANASEDYCKGRHCKFCKKNTL